MTRVDKALGHALFNSDIDTYVFISCFNKFLQSAIHLFCPTVYVWSSFLYWSNSLFIFVVLFVCHHTSFVIARTVCHVLFLLTSPMRNCVFIYQSPTQLCFLMLCHDLSLS